MKDLKFITGRNPGMALIDFTTKIDYFTRLSESWPEPKDEDNYNHPLYEVDLADLIKRE